MKNKKILNVGCGTQTYGTHFIDVYPSRDEVKKCDVGKEKIPFKNKSFDEVFSRNLFEHISNLNHLLSEMNRVLKKKGKIVLVTDNAGFLPFHIPIRKNNFLQHYSNSIRLGDRDKHYFLFTPLHLSNLLSEHGFTKIKVNYIYDSHRKTIKALKPFINLLNNTFLVRLINPRLIVEAYKK